VPLSPLGRNLLLEANPEPADLGYYIVCGWKAHGRHTRCRRSTLHYTRRRARFPIVLSTGIQPTMSEPHPAGCPQSLIGWSSRVSTRRAVRRSSRRRIALAAIANVYKLPTRTELDYRSSPMQSHRSLASTTCRLLMLETYYLRARP
jgi:hypothetical protein